MERVGWNQFWNYKWCHIQTMLMTSLIFCFFWKVLSLCSIPTKFHCCQTPNGRVKLGGGGLFAPPSIIGVSGTLSKIGLMRTQNMELKKLLHKSNRLCMCRINPIIIHCFVSALDWCIPEKIEKGHSSQFCELFLMVWIIFNQNNHQIETFFSYMKTLRVKHKILPSPLATFVWLTFDGPISKLFLMAWCIVIPNIILSSQTVVILH